MGSTGINPACIPAATVRILNRTVFLAIMRLQSHSPATVGTVQIDFVKSEKHTELNQATFAEKAGISLSIYSKWEGGSRQPSRKMFRQLVNTYPEINI